MLYWLASFAATAFILQRQQDLLASLFNHINLEVNLTSAAAEIICQRELFL